MMKSLSLLAFVATSAAAAVQQPSSRMVEIEQSLKDDVPKILCVEEGFATGGQPTEKAFAKLAEQGFKSVLNLRTAGEGVDLAREREMVEKAGMNYISIPIVSSAPKLEQADEFIKAVGDKSHQPMLIHCGSANRVGAFWMIYRVVAQGWPQDKALDEARRIGLTSPALKAFAESYISSHGKAVK
jgi:uncharacterized protein (TIGR01244 family)